jgi:hypothetical protein
MVWLALVAIFLLHSPPGIPPPSTRCSAAELVGFLFPCGWPCLTFGAEYQSVLQLVVRSDPSRGSSLTVASLHCCELGYLRCLAIVCLMELLAGMLRRGGSLEGSLDVHLWSLILLGPCALFSYFFCICYGGFMLRFIILCGSLSSSYVNNVS